MYKSLHENIDYFQHARQIEIPAVLCVVVVGSDDRGLHQTRLVETIGSVIPGGQILFTLPRDAMPR